MYSDRDHLIVVTTTLYLFLSITGSNFVTAVHDSPLNGRHVIITGNYVPLDFDTVRNSTGYIVYINGVAGMMLPTLSTYYNFTYAPLQIKDNIPIDPSEVANSPGLLTFMLNGSCDIVTTIAATPARSALVDFSHPVLYPPVSYLIPKPVSSINVLSVAKPFKLWAWVGILGISSFVVISIYFSSTVSSNQFHEVPVKFKVIALHIFGMLLLQSGWISSHRLSVRMAIGSWSIAAFILGLMYNTELTSSIAAPNPQPIIRTIYDLRDRFPNLRLVTEKDRNVDVLLSAADNGFYKLLGDKLRSDPKSRCMTSQQCVDMVKQGNTVFTSSREAYLLKAMKDDFQATGKCNLELSKEVYLQNRIHWTTQKNSPYMDALNLGFMRMRQSGLIYKWYEQFTPDAHQCLGSNKQPETVAPFSLKHLTGAFTVLLIGYFVSFIVFIYEKIASACQAK